MEGLCLGKGTLVFAFLSTPAYVVCHSFLYSDSHGHLASPLPSSFPSLLKTSLSWTQPFLTFPLTTLPSSPPPEQAASSTCLPSGHCGHRISISWSPARCCGVGSLYGVTLLPDLSLHATLTLDLVVSDAKFLVCRDHFIRLNCFT